MNGCQFSIDSQIKKRLASILPYFKHKYIFKGMKLNSSINNTMFIIKNITVTRSTSRSKIKRNFCISSSNKSNHLIKNIPKPKLHNRTKTMYKQTEWDNKFQKQRTTRNTYKQLIQTEQYKKNKHLKIDINDIPSKIKDENLYNFIGVAKRDRRAKTANPTYIRNIDNFSNGLTEEININCNKSGGIVWRKDENFMLFDSKFANYIDNKKKPKRIVILEKRKPQIY